MIHRGKHQYHIIRLASPEQICLIDFFLPNGEIVGQVSKPHNKHYKMHNIQKTWIILLVRAPAVKAEVAGSNL